LRCRWALVTIWHLADLNLWVVMFGTMAKEDITTIKISKTIRDRLKELGKKGETYDEILERLLKIAETKERKIGYGN